MDQEDIGILCSRVEDGPASVPGSMVKRCRGCSARLHVSPATHAEALEMVDGDESRINYRCDRCVPRVFELVPPGPEAMREVVARAKKAIS